MITSASSISRRRNCIGSSVLPRAENHSEWAEDGHDEHGELDRQTATGELPPELARWLPPSPRTEVKLAWDVFSDVGRILGYGAGRNYDGAQSTEIVGSCDVIGVDGDTVIILDWKTGFADVEPAATNSQLWFYALAAARALGCSSAIVRIVYTKRGGFCDQHEIGPLELAEFASELRDLNVRIEAAKRDHRDGKPVNTYEGSWCKHCSSKAHCPSKNALLVQLSSKGLAIIGDSALTPDRAADAYREFVRIEQLVKDARARLESYVTENGPIDLGNGKLFGRFVREGKRKLDGATAVAVIRQLGGENARELEAAAIEVSVTQAGLKRAIEKIEGSKGAAKRVDQIVKRIDELGGVKRGTEYPLGEFPAGKYEVAEPVDVTEVDRLLKEAG